MMLSPSCIPQDSGGTATKSAIIQSDGHEEGLDRAMIAELPSRLVGRMDRDELIRVVRCGEILAADVQLEYLDRGTLERLTHLACLRCKNVF